jgi:hypothetical protein
MAPLERLARLQLLARYFQAGRAAEVFLQTAGLNRRPPPAIAADAAAGSGTAAPPAPPEPAAAAQDALGASGSGHHQRQTYPCPAGTAVYPDFSQVGSQQPPHHEQTQTGSPSGSFGGEKWLEDPG